MGEGEADVGGAEAREGAALVRVELVLGSGNGRQSDCHYSLEDFSYGFEKNHDVEEAGGAVGGLARLVQNHPVGGL